MDEDSIDHGSGRLDEVEDDEFDADFDCAMGQGGQCGKAGSEECDWYCPRMAVARGLIS